MFVRDRSLKVGIYFVDHLLRNLNPLAGYLLNWWTMGNLKEEGKWFRRVFMGDGGLRKMPADGIQEFDQILEFKKE